MRVAQLLDSRELHAFEHGDDVHALGLKHLILAYQRADLFLGHGERRWSGSGSGRSWNSVMFFVVPDALSDPRFRFDGPFLEELHDVTIFQDDGVGRG